MFAGKWTYHDELINDSNPEVSDLAKEHVTTIQEQSERLHLDIEMVSYEPGMGFQEHYVFSNGELIYEATNNNYFEYWIDEYETKEEYEEQNGTIPITAEEYLKLKSNPKTSTVYVSPGAINITETSWINSIRKPKINMCKIIGN